MTSSSVCLNHVIESVRVRQLIPNRHSTKNAAAVKQTASFHITSHVYVFLSLPIVRALRTFNMKLQNQFSACCRQDIFFTLAVETTVDQNVALEERHTVQDFLTVAP